MKFRPAMMAIASIAIAVVLIFCLISIAKIDPRDVLHKLRNLNPWAFLALIILMGTHIFLASLKWRTVDAAVRRSSDGAPTRSTSFALTSAGIALGQILPPSIGMVVARTLGTYIYGRPITRGTVGTLFEQGFDFLVICFLIPASLAVRFFHGGQFMWIVVSIATGLTSLLAVNPLVGWLQRIASFFAARESTRFERLQRGFVELQGSGLLNGALAHKLMLLSILRFLVLVFMAGQASKAIGIQVPLWHLAAAMPFVIFSGIVSLTPGGIGVSELTYATALNMFGTPLATAAQFSLANRFLVATASFIVALCAAGILFAARGRNRRRRKASSQVAAQS